MAERRAPSRQSVLFPILLAYTPAILLAFAVTEADGKQGKLDVLRIGTSGTFAGGHADIKKEEAAMQTLKEFIKDETGLTSEIVRQKNWHELAEKMNKGEFPVGLFQGYEFAWVQEKYPTLKPLALAVNVYVYPVAYVVTKRDNAAKDFAALKGQTVALPSTGLKFLEFFLESECAKAGAKMDMFFSKVNKAQDNYEDALDDLFDGKVQAVVADRAALEAYKRLKPGRFKQMHDVVHSQPLPPATVVYHEKSLDPATLKRFENGILNANKKDKGQTVLTLFRLTGFVTPPADFGKVLAETRKTYPAPMTK